MNGIFLDHGPELTGETSQNDIHQSKSTTEVFNIGLKKMYSNEYPKNWQKICMNEAVSISEKTSSTDLLLRQKKRSVQLATRKKQKWHQYHCNYRSFWCSCRRTRHKCFAPWNNVSWGYYWCSPYKICPQQAGWRQSIWQWWPWSRLFEDREIEMIALHRKERAIKTT